MDLTILVYVRYAPAEVETRTIQVDPAGRYECHWYEPGALYDQCAELTGAELSALPSGARFHFTPMALGSK